MWIQRIQKWLLITLLLAVCFEISSAQQAGITLILAIPPQFADVLNEALLDPFEAVNPGVTVKLIAMDRRTRVTPPAFNIEGHLSDVRAYVTEADVVPVNLHTLSVFATEAGYFLDLAPLIVADVTFTSDDFYPSTLESFEWQNGVWGLPVSFDFSILMYNKTLLDASVLSYPDASWSADVFSQTMRALFDNNQTNGTSPFPMYSTIPVLFRSFSNQRWVNTDGASSPLLPDFSDSGLHSALLVWDEMNKTGMLGPDNINPSLSATAMTIQSFQDYLATSAMTSANNPQLAMTLLPHEYVEVQVNGFAVSAGTAYPEYAYRLAKFLTMQPQLTGLFGDLLPARHTYTDSVLQSYVDNGIIYPPEHHDFVVGALTRSVPGNESLFDEYVNLALFNSRYGHAPDITSALQAAQLQAVHDLERAAVEREVPVSVAQAPPDSAAPGEVELRFGIGTWGGGIANQDVWKQFARNFAQDDPAVGQIVFNVGFSLPLELSESTDCFYLPYNAVPGLNLNTILSLDPLMDADTSFEKTDLIVGVLSQLERENRVWAYPLVIQPSVLRYDVAQFTKAGVPLPEDGWSVEQFVDALTLLTDVEQAFAPRNATAFYLLIAAYGGQPLDFGTAPPSVNFTTPTNVDAIRQVLDLARAGLIRYVPLARVDDASQRFDAAVTDIEVRAFDFGTTAESSIGRTTFPTGEHYTPVAFEIGAGYISANSQSPEACYRWFNTLAQAPDLFDAMPARYSQLQRDSASEDLLYMRLAEQFAAPNLVLVPSDFTALNTPIAYPLQIWLNRAFDNYVLNAADLEQELSQAQEYATEYLGCTADLPDFQSASSLDELSDVASLYTRCALNIDSGLSSLLGSD